MIDLNPAVPGSEPPIEWFHHNLELLLEDLELGDRTDIFFDTRDFLAIIQGMYFFFKKKDGKRSFDWESYRTDESVLVHCLATAGWLGKVKMLPPHQAELLDQLRDDFKLGDIDAIETPLSLARRFLTEGQSQGALAASAQRIDLDQLESLTGPELVATLGRKAELAKEVFKLLQCIKGSWRTRYIFWEGQGLLQGLEDFDPVPYLKDRIFQDVRQALDTGRGYAPLSNFSDALAVTVLAHRVREFRSDPKRARLPLFYGRGDQLTRAIKNAGVDQALEYRVVRGGKERTFSILRDWRYFYFRATFGPMTGNPLSREGLQDLLQQTEDLREGKETEARAETLSALDSAAGIGVSEQIERMKEFRFFDTWLMQDREDMRRVIQELKRAKLHHEQVERVATELGQRDVKEKFQQADETVKQGYRTSANTYRRAFLLLRSINSRMNRIKQWEKRSAGPSDLMFVLGPFRFPFPEEVYGQIESTLRDLLGDERRSAAQAAVVAALYQAGGQQGDSAQLPFSFGMLWATELDSEIMELADLWHRREELAKEPWFLLVWACALLRESEDKRHLGTQPADDAELQRRATLIQQARRLRQQVLDIQRSAEKAEQARLAVGIAYLDFHLFVAVGSTNLAAHLPPAIHGEEVSLLEDAVRQADEAWHEEDLRIELRLYALNQVLYYLAVGVREGVWELAQVRTRLGETAKQLMQFEGQPSWHYRYDDSLARYYEILGQDENSEEAWEMGKRYIDRARDNCFGDPVIVGAKRTGQADSPQQGYHETFHKNYDEWKQRRSQTKALPQSAHSQ